MIDLYEEEQRRQAVLQLRRERHRDEQARRIAFWYTVTATFASFALFAVVVILFFKELFS